MPAGSEVGGTQWPARERYPTARQLSQREAFTLSESRPYNDRKQLDTTRDTLIQHNTVRRVTCKVITVNITRVIIVRSETV